MKLLTLIILYTLVTENVCLATYQAQIISTPPSPRIQISPGRITLIDLGSIINGHVWLTNPQLARIYSLSGLADEQARSIIAIQGLQDQGATDLTISTEAGIKQFHLIVGKNPGVDFICNRERSRILSNNQTYTIHPSRATIIDLPAPVNEYVLAGDPSLIKLKQVVDFYHQNFLKTFALASSTTQGVTDIVIATNKGIIKFTLEIQGAQHEHTNHISFVNL